MIQLENTPQNWGYKWKGQSMSNYLKKILAIALVACLFSVPAHAMKKSNTPKIARSKVAIIEAAEMGDLKKLKKLIKKDKSCVNKTDENGWTALLCAADHGYYDCLQVLIAAKAQIDVGNSEDATPLIFAAQNGRIDCVNALIAAKAQIDLGDKDDETALMHAAEQGKSDCVEALIGAGAQVNKTDKINSTALIWAANGGYPDCIAALIAAGAKIDHIDKYGQTALILAAHNGHPDSIQALIAAGADVAQALRFAIKNNNSLSIKHLLFSGVDANMPINSRNETALYLAAKKGSKDIGLELLLKQANANQARTDGITPLMIASQKGHLDIVNMLTKLKGSNVVDINAKAAGHQNVSALYLAVHNNQLDVVRVLLANKADVNITADNGYTPLMIAAHNGNVEIVELLLENGADHTLKNGKGCTAHDLASKNNHNHICETLESRNSKVDVQESVINNNNE